MTLFFISVFVFGAVIGSFLNVCIYRIPNKVPFFTARSYCPKCQGLIPWYCNIPILSYLALRGRCIVCKGSIPFRYPVVEAINGGLFVLVFFYFGFSTATPVYWLLGAALVVITFIDLDHQIIPDIISLPGIVVGFLCSFGVPWLPWLDSLLGILAGGGSLFLVAILYEFLTKKEGMGGGDIKLLAMLGAFMGWQAILPIIFFSSLLGSVVGIPVMLLKKADSKLAIPFGPFLAVGALIYLLWGRMIVEWYLGFYR